MGIHFDSNSRHMERATPVGKNPFSGRKKVRIHLGSPSDQQHSIALIKNEVFDEKRITENSGGRFLRAIGLRRWVALKVSTDTGGKATDTYVKVNVNSIKKRFNLSDEELKSCIKGNKLDLSQNAKSQAIITKRKEFDRLTTDPHYLGTSKELQKDQDAILYAIKRNPETIQFANPQAFENFDNKTKINILNGVKKGLNTLPDEELEKVLDISMPWTSQLFTAVDHKKQKALIERKPDLFQHASESVQQDLLKETAGKTPISPPSHLFFLLFKQLSPEKKAKFIIDERRYPLLNKLSEEDQIAIIQHTREQIKESPSRTLQSVLRALTDNSSESVMKKLRSEE